MKTFKKLLILPLVAMLFVGCDALGDLLTITIKDVKMTKDVEVTVNTPAAAASQKAPAVASVPFTKTATVQLNETEELLDYLDNIQEINLKSIICNIHGDNLVEGDVQSLSVTINPLGITKSIPNITLGQDEDVTFTNDEFNTIANSLLSSQQLEFVLNGTVSSTPITFIVSVTVEADFKVKVLNTDE